MSKCVQPAGPYWRDLVPKMPDTELLGKLEWGRRHRGGGCPPYDRIYHDYTHLYAVAVREARKRGLTFPVSRR